MAQHRKLSLFQRSRTLLSCSLGGHDWQHDGAGSWSVHCARPGCDETFHIPPLFTNWG